MTATEPSLGSAGDDVVAQKETAQTGIAQTGIAQKGTAQTGIAQTGTEAPRAPFQPSPPVGIYQISGSLLDEVEAVFHEHTGGALPAMESVRANPFSGLKDHALGWSVARLRDRITSDNWTCMEDQPTSNAVTHVTGFLYFVATWSAHPLFPAMMATAAERGFSLHGLAPYAAAHCMMLMGNEITFPEPQGYPGRVEDFILATKAGPVDVHFQIFDRFEFPFGQRFDQQALRAAVAEAISAAQGRINLRKPGVLLLSPGTAVGNFDWDLTQMVKEMMLVLGRKNRGLMAVAPVVLRLQTVQDPRSIRFGYGCFPTSNKHFRYDAPGQAGG